MEDIKILREMLIPDVQIPLQPRPGKPSVELTDKKGKTSARIKGLPHDSVVIRAEAFEGPLTIFRGSKKERRRADFVIVSNEDTKKWVVCIETQAGNRKRAAHIKAQLKGAQCFVSYCKCIGRSFWESKEFLDNYQYRFVCLANINLDKRPTRPNRQPLHDSAEKFLKIPGNAHHFNKLIWRGSR